MADVPMLVASDGRTPLRSAATAAALAQQVARPSLTGVRQAWNAQTVTSGLTPERLARIMRGAAEGNHTDFVILAEEMEERDWHYGAVLGQRKLAVLGLERLVEACSDEKQDQDIAEAVRTLIVDDEAFEDLLAGGLDGLGKGWSAVEIGWDTSGDPWKPARYDWRDPRWFLWDRETGQQLRLLDEQDMALGIELPPYKFAIHRPQLKMGLPVRGGLARLAAWAFLFKFYSVKDWAAYCETYGQPMRVGKYDPRATKEDIEVLYQAVSMIGTDCAAVIPQAMQIEFVDAMKGASQSGADIFNKFCDWLDRQVSKAVLGQTGTTDMQKGGGLAQAKVLDGVRDDLRDSDALQLARTVRRDVIEPFVRFKWGPAAKIPGFKLKPAKAEDLVQFAAAIGPFIDRGLRVKTSQVLEKFELDAPEPGDEVLTPASAGGSSVPIKDAQAANRSRRREGVALNRTTGQTDTDAIDALSDPLNAGWQEVMDPLLEPIEQLAQRCTSAGEFLAALADAGGAMDVTPLARSLALQLFKAKGLGDATDGPL